MSFILKKLIFSDNMVKKKSDNLSIHEEGGDFVATFGLIKTLMYMSFCPSVVND